MLIYSDKRLFNNIFIPKPVDIDSLVIINHNWSKIYSIFQIFLKGRQVGDNEINLKQFLTLAQPAKYFFLLNRLASFIQFVKTKHYISLS
jgi:hypothetical protein